MNADTLETIRLTLLFSLVVLLGIILYKRLIRNMKKGELVEDYIDLGDLIDKGSDHYELPVDFPRHETVSITIHDKSGKQTHDLFSGNCEPGEQTFSFDLNPELGKHTLVVKSDRQKTELFIG